MDLFNQPHKKVIGDKLKDLLNQSDENRFDIFYIMVAYVKASGLSRIQSDIERFKSSGGHVKAVVGVGQRNTSIQGLQLLLQLCDEAYIYHNEFVSLQQRSFANRSI